jgi:hypothetical protein
MKRVVPPSSLIVSHFVMVVLAPARPSDVMVVATEPLAVNDGLFG